MTPTEMAALHGFQRAETGGGCTGLERKVADGTVLITATDAPTLPETVDSPCIVGEYDADGDMLIERNYNDLATALVDYGVEAEVE